MDDLVWTVGVLATVIGIYFAPTMVAADRKVPNFWSIAAVNFFLGWTLVGWVVALALALRDRPKATAAAQPGDVRQLQELVTLHRQGVLTDDEFAAAKTRLLKT